jgi:methyl-accepting chemotaxis protein
MAGSGLPYTGSFPNVASLSKPHGEQAAEQLDQAYTQLHEVGADSAVERIARIDTQVGKMDFPILAILANPERAADDVTDALQYSLRRLHAWRNSLALFPLLLTWLVVGLLALRHPSPSTQLLWEQGFGISIPLFSVVALADFVLLVVVLILTVCVHRAEAKAAKKESKVLNTLFTAMNTLEVAVKESTLRPPDSAHEWAEASQRWAEAVERIIENAMEETRQLARTSQEAIAEGTAGLAEIQRQGREYLDEYTTKVQATLEAVRTDNEQFIKQTATEARETLQRLVEVQMQRWAVVMESIVKSTSEETRQLARTTQEAIAQGSVELTGIQRQGREYLGEYSAQVRATLETVRRDNAQFINRTATEARETLQRLVEVQMEPLIKQLTGMLAEFGRHQETYRAGLKDLSIGVTGIREAARELTSSANGYDRTADALAKSLTGIETAQKNYASQVARSAASLTTAATAMSGFEGSTTTMRESTQKLAAEVAKASGEVQRSVTDVRNTFQQMAGDVTSASSGLEGLQRKLAGTSRSLNGTSGSLDTTAKSLLDATEALDKVAGELRKTGVSGSTGAAAGPRRNRKLFWPPTWFGR